MANPDIIIIDDDPMVGELSKDLLTEAGWNVVLVQDSLKAIDTVKKFMPKLVISDIMMPGINGMEICKKLKTSPQTKQIKVMIVSGKSYDVEKQRAFQLGADYFLQKPYNIDTFSKTVKSIMEGTTLDSAPPPAPITIQNEEENIQGSDLGKGDIRLTFYGSRSMPAVIPSTPSEYGRQTACVSLETSENIFIFDAGTGIVDLGKEITAKKRHYKEIWLFLSHFHIDNIAGLPYFEPLHDPRFSIHIVGPNDPEKSLKELIRNNFYSSFSPIKAPPRAKIDLYEILEDSYELMPGMKLTTMYSNHPTTTMLYFAEINGFKAAYASDSEIWGDATALQDYDERLGKFTSGYDLLIHDSYYNAADYEKFSKKGHSTPEIVAAFAMKNEIKNYLFFNINANYSDQEIRNMKAKVLETISKEKSALNCAVPAEKQAFLYKV